MKFVLASQNVHKQRELQAVLAPYGVELLLQRDLGVQIDVDETGATFAENARLKADAVLHATGLAAIADDSGLMVDALGGAPGVYSARYGAPACKTDADRNEKLLAALQGVPDEARTARFVCALCCALPDGRRIEAEGACPGVITRALRGDAGFGYDPLFYIPSQGKTFAQLDAATKNALSHRGRAIQEFMKQLQKELPYADK